MSEDWQTKYGTRRVRRDPPTLEEAIFAAAGITEDHEAQAEIAAALMGMDFEPVLAEVKKTSRLAARSATRVITGEQGAQRAVVVVRRLAKPLARATEISLRNRTVPTPWRRTLLSTLKAISGMPSSDCSGGCNSAAARTTPSSR